MRKLGKKNQVKKDRWNVFIATPAYDGKCDTDFAQSLAESAFCAFPYQVEVNCCVMGNGAFIDLSRNIFVKMFLEKEDLKECTHLFFIDSDLKFPPNAFVGLIRSGHDICAGVYRRRQEPEDYPCQWAEHPEMGGLWVENDWLMCNRVPTGFLCISRKVLEEMSKDAPKLKIHGQDGPVPQLFYTKTDEEGRFIGEDYSFCDDYTKKYNKKIPVWPNIDFVHGGYPGNFHEWLEKQIELEEAKKDTSAA